MEPIEVTRQWDAHGPTERAIRLDVTQALWEGMARRVWVACWRSPLMKCTMRSHPENEHGHRYGGGCPRRWKRHPNAIKDRQERADKIHNSIGKAVNKIQMEQKSKSFWETKKKLK